MDITDFNQFNSCLRLKTVHDVCNFRLRLSLDLEVVNNEVKFCLKRMYPE